MQACSYTLCIDSGGTKTLLEVYDDSGNLVPIEFRNQEVDTAKVAGCNINLIGEQKAKELFKDLFQNTRIKGKPLLELAKSCSIVAGMAGLGNAVNVDKMAMILSDFGFSKESLTLQADANMSLNLIDGDGSILIAGTGSICLGRKAEEPTRIGGYGRYYDKGCGFHVGLMAIEAGLQEEIEKGDATKLTPALRSHFGVEKLKDIIPGLYNGDITPAKIAALAPIVFEHAKQDRKAESIVQKTIKNITKLFTRSIERTGLKAGTIHLWGGIFNSNRAESIEEHLKQQVAGKDIKIVNMANRNVAALYYKKRRQEHF